MNYQILLTYRDDKTVNIVLPEDQIQGFFDNLNSGKVHLNQATNIGFWTSVDQLRHIIVSPHKEKADECNPEDQQSIDPVPSGDEDNQSGENPDAGEGKGDV